MKKIIRAASVLLVLALLSFQLSAQQLESGLSEAWKALQEAGDMPALMNAGNKFNLIAAKWPEDRNANYYAAYARIQIAAKETDAKRKDQLLDEADKYVAVMNSIDAANDESLVLTAYAAFARFQVDPANRWRKYLEIMNENLEKAKKANADNPRIYYLEGIPVFNKPVLYGGGKKKAKPYFEKAKTLFAKQTAGSILKPYWGEKENEEYLVKCD
ncbi:hypothetical protein HHL16_14475 [Pseudoflavitalea sp. G-6-1-2]|uniref:hypothetical protein n=1 Tax=Pseudoflavitalea sp. G-6-1-2 TaxID=2728841 RepID=UPI00146EB26E|nr:hypothetical protein [Pseudoflavitalea sp. G-6-1-2]NML22085.1 hypothetical protein [Pseudoflavitalea sp. G-6-1-2]